MSEDFSASTVENTEQPTAGINNYLIGEVIIDPASADYVPPHIWQHTLPTGWGIDVTCDDNGLGSLHISNPAGDLISQLPIVASLPLGSDEGDVLAWVTAVEAHYTD